MQCGVRLFHGRADPGALAVFSQSRTLLDDLGEVAVDAGAKTA